MTKDEDDDVLMLSATYCELMHINLYWSLIGFTYAVNVYTEVAISDSVLE